MIAIKENIWTAQIQARLPKLTDLITQNPVEESNVSRGELGVIMYFFYLSRIVQDERLAREAYTRLQKLLRELTARGLVNAMLSSGLAGLGLALEVLINEGFIEDEYDDFLGRVDDFVFESALKKIQKEDTDFLHGGTGGFHYLYYRLNKNPKAEAFLAEYVRTLAGVSRPHQTGSYLKNAYMHRNGWPDEINFSLSHGMASSILVLLNVYESGIEQDLAELLIRNYIHFITRHKRTGAYQKGKHGLFPNTVVPRDGHFSPAEDASYLGGLRWCYGDLNVTHFLYKAAEILKEHTWFDLASETGKATLDMKDIGDARCHGSLFCHGATGIAHYYDYLQRISGLQDYQAGYDHWMQVAFSEYQKEEEKALYPEVSGYFLEGSVGSGLVLMNALQGEPGYWEKIWLLS
ncbi:hypothetical protein FEM33_15090 [Dyadobacter flavalbus]|uniref:Lanthionine synthetase C family protein n=1 Tax=Dyadobacter flavalbus TaxID=2579942 RepID=A0A5M8QVR0_9BACT|nr:lanthionine synthetase LanC family protein [Dyadobacter flavalbus]KAA6438894.1 hypothetical protein FEM33_15090 [Dyadobacter flavalbus]